MSEPIRFNSNTAARVYHASTLPTGEAAAVLRSALEDDSWREAPEAWWSTSHAVAWRKDEGWSSLTAARECARALMRGDVTERPWVHKSLQTVVKILLQQGTASDLEPLVRWFCDKQRRRTRRWRASSSRPSGA